MSVLSLTQVNKLFTQKRGGEREREIQRKTPGAQSPHLQWWEICQSRSGFPGGTEDKWHPLSAFNYYKRGHGSQILQESRLHRGEAQTHTGLSRTVCCSQLQLPLSITNVQHVKLEEQFHLFTPNSTKIHVDFVCILLTHNSPQTEFHRL